MSSPLSSLKVKRRSTDSRSESLLGTKGSRTISTNRTTMSIQNCVKAFRIFLTLIEFIGYIIIWGYYVSAKSIDYALNTYFFPNTAFKMNRLEAYYWMQIIVQSTMIIFCMWFYIEFILYTDDNWIKEVKKAKEESKLKISFFQFSSLDNNYDDGVPLKLPKRHKSHRKRQKSIIDDCNICARLCSFRFCCKRVGVAIANTFTLTWSELHILCMISCIYYLLSVMLRVYHSTQSNKALLAVSDGLTAFGIILPPIAYSLCSRLKNIYDQNGDISDSTVAGSQWEKNKENWYSATTQMSIVQASKSILNDNLLRIWICTMFILQLLAFIIEPIAGPNKFRYYLDSMYNCWLNDGDDDDYICDPTTSQIIFIVHVLLLRIAIPLLLINTILSFFSKSSHSAQIMDYNHFHHILTPSAIIVIVGFAFLSNYFLFHLYDGVTISYIIILILFAFWQIFLFIRLLQLAEDAENDQEQFYAFTRNASLFNYFSKGLIMLILWAMSFGSLVIYEGNNATNVEKERTYREIPSIIFAVASMFMLVPLQKVAISPTYKRYFRRKRSIKYLATFHIICLFCILFISQKIIFIASFYYDLFNNQTHLKSTTYATSFSLSFASIGFFLWLFGKYSGILFPIIPKTGRNKDDSGATATEMSTIRKETGKNQNNNNRKDSKLSLTELYNRKHTPSLPDISGNEDDGFDLNIDGAHSLQPQRTKSVSIPRQKLKDCSNNAYNRSPSSLKIKKANSISQRKLNKMGKTENEIQPIETWADAAKAYGLKSKTLSLANEEDEKYSHDSD